MMVTGQTITEQVVNDHYRVKQIEFPRRFVREHWLVQIPKRELNRFVKLVKEVTTGRIQ